MRRKIFYQPDEFETGLYTFGNEWMLESTGVSYTGTYHKYLTGEVYTLAEYDATLSKKLIEFKDISAAAYEYKKLKSNIQTAYETNLISANIVITDADLKRGYITRYFIQKHNNNQIIEIDTLTYNNIDTKYDPNAWRTVSLNWYVAGPIEDTNNGITNEIGVTTRNRIQIQLAANTIPDIATYLTNPLQFYTDTDFYVPQDINM